MSASRLRAPLPDQFSVQRDGLWRPPIDLQVVLRPELFCAGRRRTYRRPDAANSCRDCGPPRDHARRLAPAAIAGCSIVAADLERYRQTAAWAALCARGLRSA